MKRIIFGAILGWVAFCFYTGKITVDEVKANFNSAQAKYDSVKASMPRDMSPNTNFSLVDIPFYYDDTNAPSSVDTQRFLQAVEKANQEWGHACNIKFKYLGKRSNDYSSRNRSGAGLIKWGSFNSSSILGETTQGSSRGPARNFEMTLSAQHFQYVQYLNIFDHTVIHEFGHAIAFDHSQNAQSIMFWQVIVNGNPIEHLNDNDAKACQYYRYRWDGASSKLASEKAGIDVDE